MQYNLIRPMVFALQKRAANGNAKIRDGLAFEHCRGGQVSGRFLVTLAMFYACPAIPAMASHAIPELHIVDKVEHYTVTGNTARSIRAQLENRMEEDGKSRHGSTRSTFEVISMLEEADGLCRVLHQQIVVEITMELPLLEPHRKVSDTLRTQWDEAVARLYRHEEGHRNNTLQAAAALRDGLELLSQQENCITAQASMDIELERILTRLDRREAYYDRLTRDGLRDLPDKDDLLQPDDADSRSKTRRPSSRRMLPVE